MSKRRSFSPEFKAQVVLELLSGTKSSAELCRQHQLSSQLLAQWKAAFLERAAVVFMSEEQRSQEAVRIAELEPVGGPDDVGVGDSIEISDRPRTITGGTTHTITDTDCTTLE